VTDARIIRITRILTQRKGKNSLAEELKKSLTLKVQLLALRESNSPPLKKMFSRRERARNRKKPKVKEVKRWAIPGVNSRKNAISKPGSSNSEKRLDPENDKIDLLKGIIRRETRRTDKSHTTTICFDDLTVLVVPEAIALKSFMLLSYLLSNRY
jgi:hypothetical protein